MWDARELRPNNREPQIGGAKASGNSTQSAPTDRMQLSTYVDRLKYGPVIGLCLASDIRNIDCWVRKM